MDGLITTAFLLSISFFILKWIISFNYVNLPPGPPAYPIIGNLLDLVRAKDSLDKIQQWVQTYGMIFSFRLGGKLMTVISDYDLVVKALHHPHMQGRESLMTSVKAYGPGTGITDSRGEIFKQHRSFTMNVFRSFGVGKSTFERVVSQEGKCLLERLTHCTDSTELGGLMGMASCNIVSGIAFGKRRDYDDPELIKHQGNIRKYFHLGGPGAIFFFSKFLCNLPFGPSKRAIDIKKSQINWFKREILEHKANMSQIKSEADYSDYIYAYLHKMENLPETKDGAFNDGNLYHILSDLYFAGTETTSGAMLWAMLFLMTHPNIQEVCRKEVDSILGRHKQVKVANRTSFPFVMATIEEVLRMAVQTSFGLPHNVERDVVFEGYNIPKDSLILYNNYFLCRSEKYWNKPQEFNPYRHLNEDGKVVKPKEVLVFGLGKRSCAGEELARMEIFLWITTILQNLEIKCPPNYTPPDFRDGLGAFVRHPLPFKVEITQRLDKD